MSTRTVRDVMTADVITADPQTPYKEIVDRMARGGVSALPVVDERGHVVGVVSEADLLHKVELAGDEGHRHLFERRRRRAAREKAAGDSAGEVMSRPAVTIGPDAPLEEAARLMDSERVKRLPVVDPQGALVGVVSRRDLLRMYTRPDDDIRADILDRVVRGILAVEPPQIDAAVDEGVVTLTGQVNRRSTTEIAVRLAHGIEGVVDVVDRLTYEYDDSADIRRHYTFDSDVGGPGRPRDGTPGRAAR
ncbi:MAG TPA: CBS domain-containing protein [Micromonosporaceae bacterium]|nr:CBS domain-containing protein [Micromonosporaceae bacterium]